LLDNLALTLSNQRRQDLARFAFPPSAARTEQFSVDWALPEPDLEASHEGGSDHERSKTEQRAQLRTRYPIAANFFETFQIPHNGLRLA